jgi:23S rRNA (adenine2503-C2)-methyltransferase
MQSRPALRAEFPIQYSAVNESAQSVAGTAPASPDLLDMTLEEVEQVVAAAGERPYRAGQVLHWTYARGATSFDAMHDLPGRLRQYLKEHITFGGPTSSVALAARSQLSKSSDGTRKLLIRLGDGEEIESVIIPTEKRVTLCMSSQVGCAMACEFCATARMGLHRNMTAAEILAQVHAARRELAGGEELTNFVFMGMGEPLANYPRLIRALTIMTAEWGMGISPRRITVSTVGLVPMMEKLLAEIPVQIAVSLHATTNALRDRLAPINQKYPLEILLDACRRLPIKRRNRITFEYVMLAGVNDSIADARRLVKLLAPLRAKVNLIFYNPFEGSDLRTSPRAAVEAFQAILKHGSLTATIRESRGLDIAAACGQLYAQQHVAQ